MVPVDRADDPTHAPRQPRVAESEAAVEHCADEFVQLINRHLKDHRGVHIETAVTAAGGMAGYLLLRGAGIDLSTLTPGTTVLVGHVNEVGPQMIGFLAERCIREGLNPHSGWTAPITDEHQPLVPSLDLVRDLYPGFAGLMTKCGAAEESRPRVAAAAAIKLVRMGSHVLDPEVGKAIALWSMLSASKTVPHPVAT